MVKNKLGNNRPNGSNEYKNFASNTFYSFLIYYGSLFFMFVNSFLLARLISDESWGFLILAQSYITIIVIITSLLPPGLNYALNYYIPRYIVLKQGSKIKSLIKNAIITKLAFLIPVFIISILFIIFFANIFAINLEENISLLFILSPLIFINSFNFILDAINRGFSRFKFLFFLILIKNAIHISPLFFYYIFEYNISIGIIAFVVMICNVIPFLANVLFILIKLLKIKTFEDEKESFKKDFKKTFNYGSHIGFSDLIERIWKESQIQGIGIFDSTEAVTGFSIGLKYKAIGLTTVTSFNFPLLTSYTSLDTKENFDQINKMYRITLKVTLFLLLIISGVLFFSVDFLLDAVFLEKRLIYSSFLRLILLATIFKILEYFVRTLLYGQHKVKSALVLKAIYMTYTIPLFFVGLIYFGVEGAIFLGLIIGNIISLVIQIVATYKIGNIKLNIKQLIFQYLTFIIPLVITMILEVMIFKQVSKELLLNFGLTLIKNFDFLSISSFIILFILMNLVLKTVRSSDIKYFESLLKKNRFLDKTLIKGLNILKKFTRD